MKVHWQNPSNAYPALQTLTLLSRTKALKCNLAWRKASLSSRHCVLQELCSALEVKEELYQELMNKGHQLLAVTPEGPDSNTEQDLTNLKDKWEAVQGKVAERRVCYLKPWRGWQINTALSLMIHNFNFRSRWEITDTHLSHDSVDVSL